MQYKSALWNFRRPIDSWSMTEAGGANEAPPHTTVETWAGSWERGGTIPAQRQGEWRLAWSMRRADHHCRLRGK